MTNRLATPLKFEVWHGRGFGRRKIEVASRAEADRVFDAFERTGKRPSMFLGSMLVRGER